MIQVGKNIQQYPKASGKLLLFDREQAQYHYSVFVTHLDLPAQQIWNLYRDRSDAENRTTVLFDIAKNIKPPFAFP